MKIVESEVVDGQRRSFAVAAVLAAVLGETGAAVAADYPGKPIKLVVPFPPGGGTDVMGRLLGQALAQELKATVIVENVPGATGTLGSAQVARSNPDGYTLLLGISATHAIAPALFKDIKYQPERDFVAIARLAHGGNVLVANPAFAANSAAEMIVVAKRSGAPLMYGSWGNGSGGHLAMESIKLASGADLQHVPYKGVAPLLQDVLGGQLQVAMSDVASTLPLIRAGKVKALAVTGRRRSSALPDVATLRESGLPFDTESWYALFAPARTPPAVVQLLARASAAALARPEMVEKVRSLGMEGDAISRDAFDKEWHQDIAIWAGLVQASGAKAD